MMKYKLEIVERDGGFHGVTVNGEWHRIELIVNYYAQPTAWHVNMILDHPEAGKWNASEYMYAIDINLEVLKVMVKNLEGSMNGPEQQGH